MESGYIVISIVVLYGIFCYFLGVGIGMGR